MGIEWKPITSDHCCKMGCLESTDGRFQIHGDYRPDDGYFPTFVLREVGRPGAIALSYDIELLKTTAERFE